MLWNVEALAVSVQSDPAVCGSRSVGTPACPKPCAFPSLPLEGHTIDVKYRASHIWLQCNTGAAQKVTRYTVSRERGAANQILVYGTCVRAKLKPVDSDNRRQHCATA